MLVIAAQAVKLLDLPRFPPRPAKSIQSKLNGGRKRKHAEDWWDSSDTCDTIETKKRKKNQVTKHKTVRKKRKTKKHRKSRKGTERLPKRRAREQDIIFTALWLVRMDKNDNRIPLVTSFHRRVTSFQSVVSSFQGEN